MFAGLCAALSAQVAHAQAEPLGAEALAQCAQQVRHLRSEAPRLLARNAQLDVQRESIQQRQRAMTAEAQGIGSEDLKAGLDYSERRRVLNDEAKAFNLEIERIKNEIRAINAVKQQYAANCAQRSYRRSDFERLDPEAQAAMRAGLEGIEVPYTEP